MPHERAAACCRESTAREEEALETKPGAPVVGDQAVGGLGIPIVMLSLPGSPAASTRESAANRARCRSTDAF